MNPLYKVKNLKSGIYKDRYYKNYAPTQVNNLNSVKKEIKRIKKIVNLKGPLCDLGSGIGLFLKACEEYGIKAVGVEGSKYAVDFANQFSKNLTVKSNLEKPLPFSNSSFQMVYCNQVLEHLTSSVANNLIGQVFRILKPNGYFVCSCPNYYDFSERVSEHINLYTPTRLKKALEANQFKILYEHMSFNLSLLTPWENPQNDKCGIIRSFLKKNSFLINVVISPLWLPIRLINTKMLNLENLDVFSGTCYFIAQKYES